MKDFIWKTNHSFSMPTDDRIQELIRIAKGLPKAKATKAIAKLMFSLNWIQNQTGGPCDAFFSHNAYEEGEDYLMMTEADDPYCPSTFRQEVCIGHYDAEGQIIVDEFEAEDYSIFDNIIEAVCWILNGDNEQLRESLEIALEDFIN